MQKEIWNRIDDKLPVKIDNQEFDILENNFTFLDSIETNMNTIEIYSYPGTNFKRNNNEIDRFWLELYEGVNCVRVTQDDVEK